MNNIKYIRCYTCGKHFPAQDAQNEHFCSDQCMAEFTQCPVCRKYFRKVTAGKMGKWCSDECRKIEQGDEKIEVTL
ncbi:MAG: hypothetical protein PQJ59_01285 [Spirochaetales bacterium]|nr:hypothetical protein [Spirochaetales bacterium]